MEKTKFKNLTFYRLLVGYLIILLIWNGYVIVSGNIIGVLPLLVQLTLLFLIFDKNKLAKLGIKIWSIILIIGPGLSISGGLIKVLVGENFDFKKTLSNLIILVTGILVFYFNKKSVEIVTTEKVV